MKNMISFIVIGRNEGWKLSKCLESIKATVKYNLVSNYEIIYVDSNSSDDSIARAMEHNNIKIVKLTGDCNPAIARNTGFYESSGNIIYFIDGDMVLKSEFLSKVFSEEKGLKNEFISGNWINCYYNEKGSLVKTDIAKNKLADKQESVTGGLFLIMRDIYEDIGGMDPRFKFGEDIDLGLRLAKRKILLMRKKEIAAFHHTISYSQKSRTWNEFRKHLYGRSLLYRKHIYNRALYKRLLRNEYSLLLLLSIFLLALITGWFLLFIIYLVIISFRSKLFKRFNLNLFVFLIFRDLIVFFGFFFFYPKPKYIIKNEFG